MQFSSIGVRTVEKNVIFCYYNRKIVPILGEEG